MKFNDLVHCPACALIATKGLLDGPVDSVYHPGPHHRDSYLRHVLGERLTTWNAYWSLLEPYRRSGTLLEVGAGYGHFVSEATKHGWVAVGLEPSRHCAALARQHLGVDVRAETLANLPRTEREFDVVALWDVIEHLSDPMRMLSECHDRVRPDGVLVLRTPDARILTMRPQPLRERLLWAAHVRLVYPANPREHVYHYTADVLGRMVCQAGFTVERAIFETLPMHPNLKGRYPPISLAKRLTACLSRRMKWPHEFTLLARKPATP